MNQAVEYKGLKSESLLTSKKKTKDKKSKSKDPGHVRIIDDDAPIPLGTATELDDIADNEIVSFEDAPIIVGIVDERPSDIRERERFNNAKRWRTAAFEEVSEHTVIEAQSKVTKTSSANTLQQQHLSDDSDPDIERRRSKRTDQNRDLSPPRRKKHQNDSDLSPPRRRRPSDDSDLSPPRRRRPSDDNDDDLNPPRRHNPSHSRNKHDVSPSPRKRQQSDDDISEPRRKNDDFSPIRRKSKFNEDSKSSKRQDISLSHRRQTRNDDNIDSSRRRDKYSSSHRKNARHSRQESSSPPTQRRKVKEEISSSVNRKPKHESSSPSPQPSPFQPAKSERKRLAEHKEEIAERYQQWGRGLAQVRQTENDIKDYLELAAKPLARYRDDTDLDAMLKQREREDDPMLKYLSNKTSDTGNRTDNSNNAPVKPRYKGPDPQKNRFDIWPGYRWDGVDRSNGYEKKLFESIANRHAKSQEAYLWSVEDM